MENATKSQNIESIILEESKIDITRDGTGKTLGIIADYLGAMKQTPVLLKEIYNLMPNIITRVYASSDIGQPVKNIVINELKVSNFYLKEEDLEKISFETYIKPDDLRIELSINSFNYINNNGQKSSPYYYMGCFGSVYLWIDPLKFEPRKLLSEEEQNALRKKYGIDKNDYVIIGGSITSQESQMFIHEAMSIKNSNIFSNRRVVTMIIPRTETASKAIKCEAKKMKLYYENRRNHKKTWSEDIIFDDEKGILADLYSIADLTFIGGTLFFGSSGQNPLEPAFYGKRIIAGTYKRNNIEAFDGLNKSGLLTYVNSEEELKREFAKIIPEEEMEIYKKNAAEFIKSKQGAAIKYAKIIREIIYGK